MKHALADPLGEPVRRSTLLLLTAVLTFVAVTPVTIAKAAPVVRSPNSVEAIFEGRPIDLATGWGEARACMLWSDVGVVECFRTETAMDKRIAELERGPYSKIGTASGSQCSGYVRLYDGTGYSGQVLYIRDRLQWINLSGYSFSNKTSSFKIGPCSTYLADGTWGGGSWYPTSGSQAWDVASVMAFGWNNRVSSIYIQ